VRFFRRTYHGDAVREGGFRDAEGGYLTTGLHRGVWISDRPLDVNDGAEGDEILVLEAPESVIGPFEWVEEGKPYREFLVPAAVLNEAAEIVDAVLDWVPEDDRLRRARGLPERAPGWQVGDPLPEPLALRLERDSLKLPLRI
jgi:hypothetical protein